MPILETYICAMIALCAALGIIFVDIKQRNTNNEKVLIKKKNG